MAECVLLGSSNPRKAMSVGRVLTLFQTDPQDRVGTWRPPPWAYPTPVENVKRARPSSHPGLGAESYVTNEGKNRAVELYRDALSPEVVPNQKVAGLRLATPTPPLQLPW